MIELLILYELSSKVLTMYGISKEIKLLFSVLTTPSFGTIKPALNRLESNGFIKSQRTMTEGGKRSTFYSITNSGRERLTSLILAPVQENPVQFLTSSRVKLVCSDVLDNESQIKLFKLIKSRAEEIVIDTKNIIQLRSSEFYTKMVLDNLLCECKNLISLLEGFERACKN